MSVILKAENISKQYRLGTVGSGTLSDDLKRLWYSIRGKEDPFLKVGEVNERNSTANSDYVWALKDINFEVERGEILGIIGKNGAGKSTLLKLLSRVTAPTTGTIKTKGRIASLLEVGTGFHSELTGRENIFMNGAVLGMNRKEIRSKIDEIITFSGCERYIDTPVKRYSSGMTVRLGFAVAAHLDPEILVVDEVLAVGDADFQKKAIGKMQDLSTGEGRTVLFVSHNMASIKSLCNRAILLENGQIIFNGEIEEAVNKYLTQNNSTQTNTNIANREDREGNGKLLVESLSFLNNKNEEVNAVISGESLTVKIGIEKITQIEYDRLIVSVAFTDKYDNTVLLFSSDEIGVNFLALRDSNFFKLNIPAFFLRGGDYSIRIVMAEGPARQENFLDVINNVSTIRVIPGDIYHSKKVNRSLNQAILPGNFEVS